MQMTAYVLYDRETGEVLHVHLEPRDLDSSAEEVIQQAGLGRERRLEILELPASRLPMHGSRVEDGKLREVDEDVGVGGGSGSRGFAEPDVRREYQGRG
jgi:hypothetical protein